MYLASNAHASDSFTTSDSIRLIIRLIGGVLLGLINALDYIIIFLILLPLLAMSLFLVFIVFYIIVKIFKGGIT